jgi:hypothetical protein
MLERKKYIYIFVALVLTIFLGAEQVKADTEKDLDGREGCVCEGSSSEEVGKENITWVSVGTCGTDPEECQRRCEREAGANGAVADSTTGECENEATLRDNARSKLKKISVSDPSALIGTVLRGVLGLTGSIALLMFVYGGFLWLTSGGSPDKIKKAQGILVWATLGLLLIFGSYTIVDKILSTIAS